MFDTHCHLTFPEFAGRTGEILANAGKVGVRGAITVATTSTDCLNAVALAEQHNNLWCSAGIHPLHANEPVNWSDVQTGASSPKCVAWGELGLDNHYQNPPRAIQLKILESQLSMIEHAATDSQRPLIIHCRDAFDDLLSIFRTTALDRSKMVFHCFTGTVDDARKVLDFGAWISFTGVVTFPNAPDVAAAAKLVPAERIMVETDSPYLTPVPFRKIRPNEPKYVVHTAKEIANLRSVRYEDFERQLDANAERFFGISLPSLPQTAGEHRDSF